jgi:hypothetical protein
VATSRAAWPGSAASSRAWPCGCGAVVIAIVVAVLAAIGGNQFAGLTTLNGLPRLPIGGDTSTAVGIVTALVALIAALVGAVLGGLAGMRYRHRIDRVGAER